MNIPNLRVPDYVMRLERLGSFFPSRLSFIPQLLRRIKQENWTFSRTRFEINNQGFGTAVYQAQTQARTYSLIVFSHDLSPDNRSDRVIAEAWDATFNLFDGIPTQADIDRLAANTPKQEAGRYTASELCLSRANKSVRLFDYVKNCLAQGQQPEAERLTAVGYLMRTTAVYGSGKFGCADRGKIADRAEFGTAFQVEMLGVYLFRWFTIDLVNHCAKAQGGEDSAELDEGLSQCLGIGNSTGLGMSPFLLRHYKLINQWVSARETALARVRALPEASHKEEFLELFARGQQHIAQWNVDDEVQSQRIERTQQDLRALEAMLPELLQQPKPWDAIMRHVEAKYGIETQEFLASMLIAPHGEIVDDLGATMRDESPSEIDVTMTIADLKTLIGNEYNWVLQIDFTDPQQQKHFWYYSEDKIEPRFGHRYDEDGANLEMPLTVARDVQALYRSLADFSSDAPVAEMLLKHPEYRNSLRRIQAISSHPYGEIRDNLIAEGVRPLDILRLKLSFFGVMKFDPKSDLWLRVNMFQGAPLPPELHRTCTNCPSWAYPLSGNHCCWHDCTKP